MTYNGEFRSVNPDDLADLYPGEKDKVKRELMMEGMVTDENREGGAAVVFGTSTELEAANRMVIEAAERDDAIHELRELIERNKVELATGADIVKIQTSRKLESLNGTYVNEKNLLKYLALEQGDGILEDGNSQNHEYALYYNTGNALVKVKFNLSEGEKVSAYVGKRLALRGGYREEEVMADLLSKCGVPVVSRSKSTDPVVRSVRDLTSLETYIGQAKNFIE